MATSHFVLLSLVALTFCYDNNVFAYDPSPLQDFCVADFNSTVLTNGVICKDPRIVQADDFLYSGLHIPGNTSNPLGFKTSLVSVYELPGLNTLGIAMARVDMVPGGVNPPHTHPRASELVTIIQGTLLVGFVTSAPDYRLITKVLKTGDVFAVPMGLVHFQRNVGKDNVRVVAAFNSHAPGLIILSNSVFGSTPSIPDEELTRAFQVEQKIIELLKSPF